MTALMPMLVVFWMEFIALLVVSILLTSETT
jgi:hypothetical protein